MICTGRLPCPSFPDSSGINFTCGSSGFDSAVFSAFGSEAFFADVFLVVFFGFAAVLSSAFGAAFSASFETFSSSAFAADAVLFAAEVFLAEVFLVVFAAGFFGSFFSSA